jgi:hypothetical protein
MDAVHSAYQIKNLHATFSPATVKRVAKWPAIDLSKIESIGVEGGGLPGLEKASPVKTGGDQRRTEEVIDALFPGYPLICCGWSPYDFDTRPRQAWHGHLSGMPFIVPSPMSARRGIKADGKESKRCLNNTGPRVYQVVEFDFKEKAEDGRDTPCASMLRRLADREVTVRDLCASLLSHLAHYAPLVLVVFSGGKSLHGWFRCAGQPEADVLKFMRSAVGLGADPATACVCQMVRMPDGTRTGGDDERQTVHYYDPEVANAG